MGGSISNRIGRGSIGGSISSSIGGGDSSVVVAIADNPPITDVQNIDSDSDDKFFDALSDSHSVECQIDYWESQFDLPDLDSEPGQSSNESEFKDKGLNNSLSKTMSIKFTVPYY